MSDDFEEYAKMLSKKVENIPPFNLHIMKEEENNQKPVGELLSSVLDDVEEFSKCDLVDFQNYEKWLEENGGANQKR